MRQRFLRARGTLLLTVMLVITHICAPATKVTGNDYKARMAD